MVNREAIKPLYFQEVALGRRKLTIELPSGEIEVLATSLLDKTRYGYCLFKQLYQQRWMVEEDYKVMKSRLEIENFTGKSVEAIYQDIHAAVLTKNIAAVAIFEADKIKAFKCKTRKYHYRINFSYALSQLKDNVIRFMMKVATADLSHMFITQIATVTNAFRPNRKFARPHKRMCKNKNSRAYKRKC